MKKLLSFYLFLFSMIALGQSRGGGGEGVWLSTLERLKPAVENTTIEGSKYLFPNWEGNYQLFVSENKAYLFKNLNYNIYTKKLESKFEKDSVYQFDAEKLKFFTHDSKKYKFYSFNNDMELFEELYFSNKIIFFKGYRISYIVGVINPMTNEVISNARYEKVEKYFYKVPEKELIQIELKKKTILNLFGDQSKLIENYVSENKLNYKNEADVIKIMTYYNSI